MKPILAWIDNRAARPNILLVVSFWASSMQGRSSKPSLLHLVKYSFVRLLHLWRWHSSDHQANSDTNSQLHRNILQGVSLLQRDTFETALAMTTLASQATKPLSSVLQDLVFCWLYLSISFYSLSISATIYDTLPLCTRTLMSITWIDGEEKKLLYTHCFQTHFDLF